MKSVGLRTLKRLAPWLLLGPITGFLAEGVYRNIRRGEEKLAWLYAIALGVSWYDMANFGAQIVASMHDAFRWLS
jgi:hypothetical protein